MGKFKNKDVEKVVSIDYKDTEGLWKDLFADLHEAKNIQKRTYFERRYLKMFLVEVESLITNYGKFLKVKGIGDEIKKFQTVKHKFFHLEFQRCHSLYLQYGEEHKIPLKESLKALYNSEYDNIRNILIDVFTAINEKLIELIVEMTERPVEKTFDDEHDPIIKQIKKARWRMNKVE